MGIKEKALEKGVESPKFFTIGLAVGVFGTAALASFATWKAIRSIDEEDDERWNEAVAISNRKGGDPEDYYIPLTVWDRIKIGAPWYVPAFITATVTTVYGGGVCKEAKDRIATEVARSAAAEASHQLYREEVKKQIGEKKERDIEYEAHEREINEKVIPRITDDMAKRCGAENGEQLIYDPHTGQEWVSTIEIVRRAIQICIDDLRVNEFYDYQLLLANMGANDANLTYRWSVQSAGMDHDAIDKNTCLELHFGNHNGHEVSVAWLNIPIVDEDKL